jgi:hypothetical protein
VGDAAPPLAGWRRSLTSATSPRVLSSRVTVRQREAPFPLSTGRGLACSSAGSTTERAGVSSGTPTRARAYGGGVIYSRFNFSENLLTGVR